MTRKTHSTVPDAMRAFSAYREDMDRRSGEFLARAGFERDAWARVSHARNVAPAGLFAMCGIGPAALLEKLTAVPPDPVSVACREFCAAVERVIAARTDARMRRVRLAHPMFTQADVDAWPAWFGCQTEHGVHAWCASGELVPDSVTFFDLKPRQCERHTPENMLAAMRARFTGGA